MTKRDEVQIEPFGCGYRRRVWREKGAAFDEKNTLLTVKLGGWNCSCLQFVQQMVAEETQCR